MWRDLKNAIRQLGQSPAFGATVVFSLGLAVGANAAIFSLLDAVLLRPLPYPDPERLVRIEGVFTRLPLRVTESGIELAYPVRAPELAEAQSFVAVGAYNLGGMNLGDDNNPERLAAAMVSPGIFAALSVAPVVGRAFTDEDVETNDRIAVISERLWERRFQSDPVLVDQTITLNGRLFSIVGVMPDRVELPDAVDVWVPHSSDDQLAWQVSAPGFIARLAPHASASGARDEVLRLLQRQPITRQDAESSRLSVTPIRDALIGDVRPVLILVVCSGLLVLFVASLNAATLLLTRISARGREFAVRRAIGASALQLFKQVWCETFLLAALAGLVAIPVAVWTLEVMRLVIPAGLYGGRWIAIDARALTALGALSLAVASLIALAPSLSAQGRTASALLLNASVVGDRAWRRFRSSLVTMEIAVAVAILVAAATFVRTVGALMLVEIGPNNDGAIVVEVSLPRASYATTTQVQRFYDHLDDELRALAGIQATGATNHLPGSSTLLALSQPMTLENLGLSRTSVAGNALRLAATPGYFRAIGIDVLAGRAFTDVDREGTARTAIVSERYARAFGLEPPDIVGLRVNVGVGDEQWAEVVGVVRDVRMRGPESDLQPAVYTPFAQTPVNLTGFVVVRTAPGFRDPSARLRSAVDRIDPTLPLYNLRTFGQVQSEYLAARRFTMIALVSLASVAASLASLGLYGILSYLVRLRTREIGVRIALGATSAMLHRDVIAGGVRHAVAGIGLGLALALGLWRVVSAHVPGMEQLDTLSVTIVCSVVFVLSICAAWLPARRAASVDPLVALRAD